MRAGDDRLRAAGRERLSVPARDGTSRSSEPEIGALGARIA
jgi:hypothetical protein